MPLCAHCFLRDAPVPPPHHAPWCDACRTGTRDRDADSAARLARAAALAPPVHRDTFLVWRFYSAPIEYQCLSPHGGDEDWICYVPPGNAEWPLWAMDGSAFGCCSVAEIDLPNGARLLVGAHS